MKIGKLSFITLLICILSYGGILGLELQKPMSYQGDESVKNWVMSEKLDGVRGYWDGKKLMTRNGNPIQAPDWFLKNFPDFELDGELWSDRGEFNLIQSTVLDTVPGEGWRMITYNVFEAPDSAGDFLSRLERVKRWFQEHPNQHVTIIPQIRCQGSDHLEQFLDEIVLKGGEGVIVKDPSRHYETGRSAYSLKVKKFEDMEGVVIAQNPGKGKFEGLLGSLTLRLDNGVEFKLGSGFSLSERKNPPTIGSVVTFKYLDFTKNGIPRFASFLRVRLD